MLWGLIFLSTRLNPWKKKTPLKFVVARDKVVQVLNIQGPCPCDISLISLHPLTLTFSPLKKWRLGDDASLLEQVWPIFRGVLVSSRKGSRSITHWILWTRPMSGEPTRLLSSQTINGLYIPLKGNIYLVYISGIVYTANWVIKNATYHLLREPFISHEKTIWKGNDPS